MDNKTLRELIDRYSRGSCSEKERGLLESWYVAHIGGDEPSLSAEEFAIDLLLIARGLPLATTHASPVRKLWPRWVAAASMFMILGFGVYYYSLKPNQGHVKVSVQNDIAPGKLGATLTLANGKKIRLIDAENGELAREAGVTISKTASGQLVYELNNQNTESDEINILTTGKGETYQVRLPDGSLVWLNAASTLKYPASFAKLKERRVELSGEGYFEIAKDKAHPFIVKSNRQEIEVLGTYFNISAYADEPLTKTTLLEGSVRLNRNTLLKPGEQASLNRVGAISVSEADLDQAVAWKNGKFMFDNESIESIMRKLSRWYNVEVVFGEDVKDKLFTVTISRYDNISKILDKIAFTNTVHFKIEGRRVTVMK